MTRNFHNSKLGSILSTLKWLNVLVMLFFLFQRLAFGAEGGGGAGLLVSYLLSCFLIFYDLYKRGSGMLLPSAFLSFGWPILIILLVVFAPVMSRHFSGFSRSKENRKKPKEKWVDVKVGDTVTFEPPNEDTVIGVVRRINAKSTTIVSQTGETWRVPHDSCGKIVKTSSRHTKPKQLELVK